MHTQQLSFLEALRNNTPSQIPAITDTRTTEEKKIRTRNQSCSWFFGFGSCEIDFRLHSVFLIWTINSSI